MPRRRFPTCSGREGAKHEEVSEAGVGEIVAAAKLKEVGSGDTLCDESAPIEYPRPMEFSPAISFALSPKTRADEDKVPQGLQRMMEEDTSIRMHRDEQTREFILSGTGQLHIEVVVDKLKRKYGAEVELKAPKVPYRGNHQGVRQRPGKVQEAVRRPRPVRRHLAQARAAGSGARVSSSWTRSSAAPFRVTTYPRWRRGSSRPWPPVTWPVIPSWTCGRPSTTDRSMPWTRRTWPSRLPAPWASRTPWRVPSP